MSRFFTAVIFCVLASIVTLAQTPARPAFIEDFLDLPAPPPTFVLKRKAGSSNVSSTPTPKPDTVPPDDAPIVELLSFWSQKSRTFRAFNYSPLPSERTVERLLDHCLESPLDLGSVVNIMPDDPETVLIIKSIYDGLEGPDEIQFVRELIKTWLTNHSTLFVEDLVSKAEKVADKDEYIVNHRELLTLSRVDWDRALPLLDRLNNDKSQPVSSTLAKWAYYAKAVREKKENDVTKYRRLLQDIVENREMVPGARDLALDALVGEGDWNGRDEWYMSLLSDETMLELKVNGRTLTGLTTLLLSSPPEKYAKLMVSLLESENATIRQAASSNLLTLVLRDDEVAIRALLRWLTEPAWISGSNSTRQQLITGAGKLKMRDAVAPLLSVVATEPENRFVAIRALEQIGDPQAIPTLRIVAETERSYFDRMSAINAINACGGYTAEEKMEALEAYLVTAAAPGGIETLDFYAMDEAGKLAPLNLLLGHLVKNQGDPGDEVASLAVSRLKDLRKTRAVIVRSLEMVMQNWTNSPVLTERLRRLSAGEADLETVLLILANHNEIREKVPAEIIAARNTPGFPRGIASCLAADETEARSVTRQDDQDASIAALGCARMFRLPLPVEEIGAMMASPNKLLALAAERYLETEDSAAARAIILARYPNEARILGARFGFFPNTKRPLPANLPLIFNVTGNEEIDRQMDKYLVKLRNEIKSDPELQAVFAVSPTADVGQKVIRVYRNRIVYTDYEDEARYRQRILTREEYDEFYRIIIDENIDGLRPQLDVRSRGVLTDFVMFGKNGGRRVFLSGRPEKKNPLVKIFAKLGEFEKGDMTIHYRMAQKIKGLEVLFSDQNLKVVDIWKKDGDFRVFFEDSARRKEKVDSLESELRREATRTVNDPDQVTDGSGYDAELRRRWEAVREYRSWRSFSGGIPGETVARPAETPSLDEDQPPQGLADFEMMTSAWKLRADGYEIRAKDIYNDSPGLYKLSTFAGPIKIKVGSYEDPITTPDGERVLAAKFIPESEGLQVLVGINLRTGRENAVAIPSAENIQAIAFVEAHRKMLVIRSRDEDEPVYERVSDDSLEAVSPKPRTVEKNDDPRPSEPQYFLVDAATGAARRVKGEFRPLEQQTFRPLQKTGKPDEFWAAIYDEKANVTSIGRFNSKTFTFTKTNDLPEIRFDSMNFWVDEKEEKVYIVYQTHLLAVPLNGPANK